jgi:hypothetical protein
MCRHFKRASSISYSYDILLNTSHHLYLTWIFWVPPEFDIFKINKVHTIQIIVYHELKDIWNVGFMCLEHLVQDSTTLKHVAHITVKWDMDANTYINLENTYFQHPLLCRSFQKFCVLLYYNKIQDNISTDIHKCLHVSPLITTITSTVHPLFLSMW